MLQKHCKFGVLFPQKKACSYVVLHKMLAIRKFLKFDCLFVNKSFQLMTVVEVIKVQNHKLFRQHFVDTFMSFAENCLTSP